MSRALRLLSVMAVLGLMASGQSNTVPSKGFPDVVEIFDATSVDVARIAPHQYALEFGNNVMRVLRARIGARGRVPTHRHNDGLIIAVTAVHLRLSQPIGGVQDIHLRPGETHWLDLDIHSETNLADTPCEFLFVEPNGVGSQVPHSTQP